MLLFVVSKMEVVVEKGKEIRNGEKDEIFIHTQNRF